MKAHDNPFRASKLAELRFDLSERVLHDLAQKVAYEHQLSAVIGRQGTGKTTLLEDMERPLLELGLTPLWVRLDQESSNNEISLAIDQVRSASPKQVVLFDGAEVLNWWQWRLLCHSARVSGVRLVATLHAPRQLPVLFETRTDWETAREFVRRLAGGRFPVVEAAAQQAYQSNEGNVREVFRACYWACALQN